MRGGCIRRLEWNRLPLDIREASSVADFKLKVST